ncbi:ras-related protein Rab-7L1-like [Acipenser ruthenus]|uniref:ras-related protein Rab-7L1-like n=1 Tax=Acipenser ruthenus TaxID=7906 RepID=UPI0015616DE6|nr:ras-related protein Rab-7L1-like [Acipenser ruthenus]
MPSEQLFKVLVIGGSQVGKTSFVKRCVGGVFTEFYKVTIGVDFAIKTIEWSNEEIVRLQFWDIQGQEDCLPITRAFFRDADACIMMFDVTSEKSFTFCEALKQAIDTEVPGKDGNPIPCVLLANKCDLAQRTVQPGAIADFGNALNFFTWMEISVKENKRVEDSVRQIVEAVMTKRNLSAAVAVGSGTVDIVPEHNTSARGYCCKS